MRDGDVAALQRLLETDPALAAAARQREHGATLLHVAVSRAGSDAGARGEDGEEEGERGDVGLRMLDLLLDAGADPDARAANGSTALHWCVRARACVFGIMLFRSLHPSNTSPHPDTNDTTGPPATAMRAPSAASSSGAPTRTPRPTPGGGASRGARAGRRPRTGRPSRAWWMWSG